MIVVTFLSRSFSAPGCHGPGRKDKKAFKERLRQTLCLACAASNDRLFTRSTLQSFSATGLGSRHTRAYTIPVRGKPFRLFAAAASLFEKWNEK